MAIPEVTEFSQNLTGVDLDTWDYQVAIMELVSDPDYLVARAFYRGDHWQNETAWIGPLPNATDDNAAMTRKEIETGLVPHPAIEEVVERHRDAIIGQEPFWSAVPRRPMEATEEPRDAERALIREWESAVTNWWDDKDVLAVLQMAVEDLALGGRGIIRIFVPEGNLSVNEGDDNQYVVEDDFQRSLDKIWVAFVPADGGAVGRDPRTMQEYGIFHYGVRSLPIGPEQLYVEMVYLSQNGKTVIRTMGQNQAEDVISPRVELELDGHLTMFEMQSNRLITKPIIGNQKLLNQALSMLSRNVNLGGFLERVILNGQLPGEFQVIDGKKVFVEYDFELGAGSTNSIRGVQIGVKEDGSAILAEPRIQYRDPVDVTCFDKTISVAYKNVLSSARQLHVLIAADATASGEARKQARDDYTKSLKRTKTRLDRAGRWILDVTTAMACLFAKQPGRYKDLRFVFNSQLDPGPISADDRAAVVSEYQADLRSQEGSMSQLGIDDTAAEQATIAAEQASRAANAEVNMTPIEKIQHARAKLLLQGDQTGIGGSGAGGNIGGGGNPGPI